jgi:hypothetical protein
MPKRWKFLAADLAITPDSWAAKNSQDPVPADRRLRVYQTPVRYSAVAYDGIGPDAQPVADGSAIDISVVKILSRPSVADPSVRIEQNEQLVSLAENNGGAEVLLGPFSEDDVSPSETVAIGIRSFTADTAVAVWLTADTGLEEPWAP